MDLNFGSVDSIEVVVFCAGARRFSVPHARFLIHPVQLNFNGTVGFDEKQLDEHLKGLKIDQLNIARVIGDTTGKTAETIDSHMIGRTTLDPVQANVDRRDGTRRERLYAFSRHADVVRCAGGARYHGA